MTSSQSLRDPPGRARRRVGPQGELEEPILAELFSVERLEQHAQTLAAAQTGHRRPRASATPCGRRVADNGRVLLDVVPRPRPGDQGRALDHAGGGMARRQLPRSSTSSCARSATTCRRTTTASCPKLADGLSPGYPRVVGLAWAYVAHTDSRFDPESLRRLVRAYQGVAAADHRRAVGDRDQPAHRARREPAPAGRADRARPGGPPAGRRARRRPARRWAGRPGRRSRGAAPRCRGRRCSTAARVQLFQRLRDQDPAVTPALRWLEELLAAPGHDGRGDGPPRAPAPGHDERDGPQRDHEHAPDLVVRLGRVRRERQPRRRRSCASGAAFGEMDFATRDRYRHAVEELARGSGCTEIEVARQARWPTPRDGRRRRHARRPARRTPVRPPPRRRSRLLPDLGRPDRASSGASAFASRARSRFRRAVRPRGIARVSSRPSRSSPSSLLARAARVVRARRRGGRRRSSSSTLLALAPGVRSRGRPRQPRGHRCPGPAAAAPPRARRRRADRPADARRRADAAHERGRRRGAGRRPRGPLPGQSRGRPALRAPVRLARRRRPRRRRATTSCSRRPRPASSG